MLKQALHWMLVAGACADVALLARVLTLRLHRVYFFITLDCLLGGLFDGVGLWLGWDSPENTRVYIYTRFLYALLLPLIAWDIFEEVKARIAKMRRVEAVRMAVSLLLIGITGSFLGTLVAGSSDEAAAAQWPDVLGLYLWGGASLTSFFFIFKVRRNLRSQEGSLPNNTFVWMTYYLLTLAASLVSCALDFSSIKLSKTQSDAVNIVMLAFGFIVAIWSAIRLRALPAQEDTVAAA